METKLSSGVGADEIHKGREYFSCEERLEMLSLFSLEWRRLKGTELGGVLTV